MDSFFDFIMTHPPVKRLRVNDLLLAEYQCPLSDYRYDIWSHHNYFIYVISGEKEWFTLKEKVHVKKGDCIFVRKGAQSVYQFFDSGFCALVLFLPDAFISTVLIENQIKTGNAEESAVDESLFTLKPDDRLDAYFQSFYTYLKASGKPDVKLIELKFRELVILSANLGNKQFLNYFASLCRSEKPSISEIMNANFNYPMSLDEYARLCGRSLSGFKREFNTIFGTSPGRWLTAKRLELAKYLLQNTDKTVMEAATDAGFNNQSHFSRAFKEKFGTAPLKLSKKKAGHIIDQ
jgi:AraC family transcriptional regulator, exoenzyme S synthesis regulatory protein ExsA